MKHQTDVKRLLRIIDCDTMKSSCGLSSQCGFILMICIGILCMFSGCKSSSISQVYSPAIPIDVPVSKKKQNNFSIVPASFLDELKDDTTTEGIPPELEHQEIAIQNTPAEPEKISFPAGPFSLTLETAIQTALSHNPDLAIIRSSEPASRAAYHVADTYPYNPQFQTQVLPYTRDKEGNDAPVSQQHVIIQTFELAHQQRYRTGGAAATWEQVRSKIRSAELLSRAQTQRLFFTALYQRDLRDQAQSLTKLNEGMVGILERRLKAGQANSADVALAKLQMQSAHRQQRLTEANYQTALMSLRNYINLPEEIDVKLESRWLDINWNSMADIVRYPDGLSFNQGTHNNSAFEASLRSLVRERPDVSAAYFAITAARENLSLANANRTPNLQAGPMWQRDDSATQFWGIQAQINIPVINTGTPLVRQRRAEYQQQLITAQQMEQKAFLEARAAIRRYERARKLVEQSRGEFAQSIPDVLKPFEDQFKAGQIPLLQVFAFRTSLAQSRQSYLDLLNELAQSAADVTLATGLPTNQLITNAPTPMPPTPSNSIEMKRQ